MSPQHRSGRSGGDTGLQQRPESHPEVETRHLPFPPHVLREYALLADGERGALIGPRGDVVFLCVPQWHDPSVFSALLGGPGLYAVTPTDANMTWGGSYLRGTLVWNSRWVTTHSIIECREALVHPGDPRRAVLLRRIHARTGGARVRVMLDLCAGYGSERMTRLRRTDDGYWLGRSGPLRFRWAGGGDAEKRDGVLTQVIELEEGGSHDLVLEIGEDLHDQPVDPQIAWPATLHAWDTDVPDMTQTAAPIDAGQSYAVLRGLTSASGAMVAAATMGLPERSAAGRNYDYRYAWVRDQCYAGQAIGSIGPLPLLDSALRFVTDRVLADGPRLRPAYKINGELLPDERVLDLPGYPGGEPKVGNWVNNQFQLDAFGEALLLLATGARHDRLELEQWRAAETLVDAITERWGEPDNGIWELEPARWAHSRLMCAAGLRAIAAHAPTPDGSRWNGLADVIAADTASDCLHPSGRWQRAPDDDRVDAALLLPSLRGAVPPDDPRTTATYQAIRRDLEREGFVYRFSQDPRPLADAEGAFVLCGFILALTAHQQGDDVEAVRWFERNRTACGSPGLFTEEFDIDQRQLRGNFPQAFVHALLIEAAATIGRPYADRDKPA